MRSPEKRPRITIVDDEPENLRLMEEMLRRNGYEVRSFPRGRQALAAATNHLPDLVLLDVNMPELTGYEVCERMKADSRLSEIPVIFLSASHETENKVKGFQCGGVDYISKPFQFEEVYARVEAHIKLRQFQQALALQNERLEETVSSRTRELAEAHVRLTALDEAKTHFLNVISHELRTPLNGLLGVAEIVLSDMPPSQENDELRQLFDRSRQRFLALMENALLLTEIDVAGANFRTDPVMLDSALCSAMERATQFAEFHRVRLYPLPAKCAPVQKEEDLMARAFQALLETAVRFSEPGATVHLARRVVRGSPSVVIESSGRRIPSAALARFFDVFSISEAMTPGGDLGLGPAVASRIISLFGGTVTVANRDPSGICLTVGLRTGGSLSFEPSV